MLNADDPMPPRRGESSAQRGRDRLDQEMDRGRGAPPAESPPSAAFLSSADMLKAMRDDLEKARAARTAVPALFHADASAQRRPVRGGDAELSPRAVEAGQQPVVGQADRRAAGRSIRPARPFCASICAITSGTKRRGRRSSAGNPYGDPSTTMTAAKRLCRGDALPAAVSCGPTGSWPSAARPPLYHDILQLPSSERELEKLLRVDVAGEHSPGAGGPGRVQRLRRVAQQPPDRTP